MTKPRLYLFIGFPGAGKTTIAKAIAERTGAVHLWADQKRLEMFNTPTHSPEETHQLYGHMNEEVDRLLGEGKSVIFDTNFNFYKDREHLRQIAGNHGADTIVIWVTTPKDISKNRAVEDQNLRNGYEFPMNDADFERLTSHLEPPSENEKIIKINGAEFDGSELITLLS